jgi:hypothetical protein
MGLVDAAQDLGRRCQWTVVADAGQIGFEVE